MHTARRPLYLGIDIGGSSIKAGLVDDRGAVCARTQAPLDPAAGVEQGLELLGATVAALVRGRRHALADLAAIGVACPGTMDIPAGIVFHPFNRPGWESLPLRQLVAERFGKPSVLQNDANAAAFGEYWAGAGRGAHSLVMWTLGTGIGGGLVINGELVEGAHSHAGECGHLVLQMEGGRPSEFGMHGSLECYAGGKALVRRCVEALEGGRVSCLAEVESAESITPRMIATAAELGDPLADELVMETARYLGVGTATMMNILDPDVVLLGGAMTFGGTETDLGRRFLDGVRQEVGRRAFPVPAGRVRIEFAKLANEAGFIGAAGWARRRLGNQRNADRRVEKRACAASSQHHTL